MRTLLLTVAFTLVAGVARGDQPREHDGFYVRAGIGPGFMVGSARGEGRDVSISSSGVAVSTELAIGTTIARGLVVGGGAFPMVVPSPRFNLGNGSFATGGAYHVSGIGPFADYYFDPKGGFHLQAGALLTAGFIEATTGADESSAGFGVGGMLGSGYEFWISDRFSVGPLLRLTYYRLWTTSSDTSAKSVHNFLTPSLLAAVTYH